MIVPVFLPHMGCGERCLYCNQDDITGRKNLAASQSVEASLGRIKEKVDVGLYGGNILGLSRKELKDLFCLFVPYREVISGFRISTKPRKIDNEVIEILKENGVHTIELGIPTFNDKILEILNRRHTMNDLYQCTSLLKMEKFRVALQVMVGLPGETLKDIKRTSGELVGLQPQFVRIYPLVVLRGTPLETLYQTGKFVPLSLEEAILRTLHIYLRLNKENIPVARMGIMENEFIREKVIAGPYHPSFGSMVKSRAFYFALRSTLTRGFEKGNLHVLLSRFDIPHLTGFRREQITFLQNEGYVISWEMIDTERGTFFLCQGNKKIGGNIFDALFMLDDCPTFPS